MRSDPLPVLRKLSKGYWPKVVEDPKTKQMRIVLVEPTADTWRRVGGVVVDSMSMASLEGMRDVIDKGKAMAQEPVTPFQESVTIVDALGRESQSAETFAAPAKAHYGFGQNLAYGLINAFSSLPVELVGFTMLEKKAEEEDRTTIYGPDVPGKAATPKVPSWVGDCLHFYGFDETKEVPLLDEKGTQILDANKKPVLRKIMEHKVHAYFMRHPDPKSQIAYPAKPRVPAERWHEMLKRFPGGYFVPTTEGGLDLYLRAVDELEASATDSMKDWRAEIDKKMGRSK